MHPVTQRQLALGALVLMWSVKWAHAWVDPGLPGLSALHLLLWLAMDAAFILTLKLARVPRLHFHAGITLLLLLSAWCVDVGFLGAMGSLWRATREGEGAGDRDGARRPGAPPAATAAGSAPPALLTSLSRSLQAGLDAKVVVGKVGTCVGGRS